MITILKNRKQIKEKLRLIEKIALIKNKINDRDLVHIKNQMDNLINLIDDKHLNLNDSTILEIDECLDLINCYLSKNYEVFLESKCQEIKILLSGINRQSFEKQSKLLEDKVYIMLGQQNDITNQINEINIKLNDSLGKNKNLWIMLNAQKKMLLKKLEINTNNYTALLNVQNNLLLNSEIKSAKNQSDDILKQSLSIDTTDFKSNIDSIYETNTGVFDATNKLNESFVNNFNSTNDDYEYEKALEEKMINNQVNKIINKKNDKNM